MRFKAFAYLRCLQIIGGGPNALALPGTLDQTNNPADVTLFWPLWAIGFTTAAATNPASGSWAIFSPAPTLASDHRNVSVARTNVAKMVRLKR